MSTHNTTIDSHSNDNDNVNVNDHVTKIASNVFSRRRLLAGAGILGATLVAAACGSDNNDAATPTNTAAGTTGVAATTAGATAMGGTAMDGTAMAGTAGAATSGTDAKIATLAAGLEVLAVGTYKAALEAATAGKLGAVPPAVANFVQTAMAQHQTQLDALNKFLTGAGGAAVTQPNATLKPMVDAAFAKVTDVTGAAQLALLLEQTAAATYQSAIPLLEAPATIQLAGSIQIIDAQHAAILLFVLGEYPVPDTFGKLDKAVAA